MSSKALRQRRYKATEKGRATRRRYDNSIKGYVKRRDRLTRELRDKYTKELEQLQREKTELEQFIKQASDS